MGIGIERTEMRRAWRDSSAGRDLALASVLGFQGAGACLHPNEGLSSSVSLIYANQS